MSLVPARSIAIATTATGFAFPALAQTFSAKDAVVAKAKKEQDFAVPS